MSAPFFSSVTRISDLESSAFKTEHLPKTDWDMGDYVLCEVKGRPGRLYQVELPSGRMCQVFDGDFIVGAFGTRAATLEGVGDWQDIGDNGKLHALTPAGLFGKATSVSPLLPRLMKLRYRGHVVRDKKVCMSDFCPPQETVSFTTPVILIIGTSMSSGKTIAGRAIVHELKQFGLKVAAAKLTGAARFRDMLSLQDAGADQVFDFVDVGLPSTVCDPERYAASLRQLLSLIASADADVLVAEAGASPLEPYNGSVAMQLINENVSMMVLCASDPYSVMGVQHAFGRQPDLVSGPASNTDAAINLVYTLCGLPALSMLRRSSRPQLREFLKEKLKISDTG